MNNGWIKLHRQILNKGYANKPAYVSLWVHLLLMATHEKREFMWNGRLEILQEGQLITGRKELSKQTGIPESTIERILRTLENGHQIGQQKTPKYRLITVCNWDKFQKRTSERTTNGQQTDTYKNVKNERSTTSPSEEDNKINNMPFNKYSDDFEEELQIEPDYKPKKKTKEPKKVSDDIQAVFDLFSNPAKVTWRLREIERVAAQALFDTYGLETLEKRIKRIEIEREKNADDPFFPVLVTPSQLLDKMPNIERYLGI